MSRSADLAPSQVLMVMPADPWAEWTMSGISRALCLALRDRGALLGAVDPNDVRPRALQGPSVADVAYRWRARLKRAVGVAPAPPWSREDEGRMGALLRRYPPGTNVVYAFHSPEVDSALPIRRFRFMDLTLPDAVKYNGYGFGRISDEEYDRQYQNQSRTLRAAVGVVTLSSYAADAVARDYGFDRSRIFPIGGGAALSRSEQPNLSPDRYRKGEILFVGRDWQRKGGSLLLQAFQQVRRAVPHATLTIVGPDSNPAPGHDGVQFVGFLAKDRPAQAERLVRLFSEATVFCMPSICETWGLVYTEAAMAGLPVVGFNEWALPDIVLHGRSGLLQPERSAEALADGLITVLKDPALAASYALEGTRYVDRTLKWSDVAERLLYAVAEDRSGLPEPAWLAGDRLRSGRPPSADARPAH